MTSRREGRAGRKLKRKHCGLTEEIGDILSITPPKTEKKKILEQ
jgi:hypothetical protein